MQTQRYGMNIFSLLALGIGSIVGAGIFALLGQIEVQSGAWSYWSFILAGIVALFSGYSYARLNRAYPEAGGLSDYFHFAFKYKWIAGPLSILYLLTSAVSISMMAKSFGIYMDEFLAHLSVHINSVNLFATALIVVLGFLNMMSASDVGRTEMIFVGIKMIILVGLVLIAFYQLTPHTPVIETKPASLTFLGSIGIAFFAYAGYGVLTNAAKDVQNPRFTIALAIYLTLIIVMMLYLGLVFVTLHYVTPAELAANPNITVAIAAQKLLGSWGYGIISLTAVLAFISGINATFYSMFRIALDLSKRAELPKVYQKPFWRMGTWGDLCVVVLIVLATLYFDFSAIVNLSSGAFLVCYLAVFVASWILRQKSNAFAPALILGFLLMLAVFIGFIVSLLPVSI